MTAETIFTACVFGLVFLIIGVSLVFRRFNVKQLSMSFPAAWAIFIIALAGFYYSGPKDAQAEMFWLFPFALALPMSLLVMSLRSGGGATEFAVLLALIGSVQYGLIGWAADALVAALKRRRKGNANQTSEVTSEHAPSADFPSPHD
jgi:uncharacterized membrane protein YhaH (DUF805 family)